ITLNYYLNYNLSKFQNGTYYIKIYSVDELNHFTFSGNLEYLNEYLLEQTKDDNDGDDGNYNLSNTSNTSNSLKRKKILLLKNVTPLNINLQIIDNYHLNIKKLKRPSVTNLSQLVKIFGLDCTHVTIMEMSPFSIIKKE